MRNKAGLAFICLSLMVGVARAEEIDPACASSSPSQIVKTIPVPGEPSFFMRAFGDGNKVSLGSDKGNILVDLDSEKIHKAPGIYDPVPFSGGTVISTPRTEVYDPKTNSYSMADRDEATIEALNQLPYKVNSAGVYDLKAKRQHPNLSEKDLVAQKQPYSKDSLVFYRAQDLLDDVKKPKPISADVSMPGVYQSTAGLKGQSVQRVAMDNNGMQFRDYNVNSQGADIKVSPAGPVRKLCPNLTLQLPMLSKSGHEISGYDEDRKVTSIYSINEFTGECRVVETLPFKTAKMDFAWNGTKVAFHIDSQSSSMSFFTKPGADADMSVFVYERSSKRLYEMNKPPNSNAYYPVFLKNGDLAYISEDKSKKENRFSVVVTRPNYAFENQRAICNNCAIQPKRRDALTFMGAYLTQRCNKNVALITDEAAVQRVLNLSESACRDLADKALENQKALTDELMKSAPGGFFGSAASGSATKWETPKIAKQDLLDACRWRSDEKSTDKRSRSIQ